MSRYDKTLRLSHHKSQKMERKREKNECGVKRFSLMYIKQFCIMQVTTGICHLAALGQTQAGFLLTPCWTGSMCSVPVICQHGKDANRFPCNELTGLEHQLNGEGQRFLFFQLPPACPCLSQMCKNLVLSCLLLFHAKLANLSNGSR